MSELAPAIKVSIVICTRNRGDRLDGTLNALSALNTKWPYEVIWVNNASTDNTNSVLQKAAEMNSRLRLVEQPKIGLGAARDLGWRCATGEIVAFTDDDCYPAPDFVDAVAEVFDELPDAGCIGGRILLHNPQHAALTIDESLTSRTYDQRSFLPTGSVQGANLSFRRSALEAAGGVDPDLGAGTPFPCEDIDGAAATLWAGYGVRFDPRPVVRHDHGRTENDRPALERSYDLGRGGYYAKYLLRKDTRITYSRGWFIESLKSRYIKGLRALWREIGSANRYLAFKRRADLALLVTLLGAATSIVKVALDTGRYVKDGGRRPPK